MKMNEEHFFAKNNPLEILLFEFISSLNSEIKAFEMDILSNFAHQKMLFVAFSFSVSIGDPSTLTIINEKVMCK